MTKRLAIAILLLAACSREKSHATNHAKAAIEKYGCTACHSIPGIAGPKGMVGPPLDHMGARQFIAGKVENNAQNMARWIENPQSIDPQNAMPNLGVMPQDAKDIAAYLESLK